MEEIPTDPAETMAGSPERFDPHSMGGLIAAEHLARYRVAASLATGKRVLDAGCGLGYGIAALATAGASSATGVDISAEAVAEAGARAGGEGISFLRADLLELPFEPESFELVTCFEAIEHVTDPAAAIAELKRVLIPDGVALVSSPHPANYPPGNPHHVRELSPDELRDELAGRFRNVELLRQHVWFASALLRDGSLEGDGGEIEAGVAHVGGPHQGLESFSLAIASDAELPPLPEVVYLAGPTTQRHLLELAEMQRTAAHARNIVASRSWRLTRPLRALGALRGRRR